MEKGGQFMVKLIFIVNMFIRNVSNLYIKKFLRHVYIELSTLSRINLIFLKGVTSD